MHIYWTYKSFPELRDLEPLQQRAAWRACGLRPFRHWQIWAAFLSAVVIILAGGFLGSVIDGQTYIWFGGSPPLSEAMRAPVAALILINVGGIIGFAVAT